VLSELPLSDTLPSQSNKSLLFHPRVAEEAKNVLSQRDDVLAQQLISAIEQTNSNHM
jgi:cohesin loading factor subunit SCC2